MRHTAGPELSLGEIAMIGASRSKFPSAIVRLQLPPEVVRRVEDSLRTMSVFPSGKWNLIGETVEARALLAARIVALRIARATGTVYAVASPSKRSNVVLSIRLPACLDLPALRQRYPEACKFAHTQFQGLRMTPGHLRPEARPPDADPARKVYVVLHLAGSGHATGDSDPERLQRVVNAVCELLREFYITPERAMELRRGFCGQSTAFRISEARAAHDIALGRARPVEEEEEGEEEEEEKKEE